MLRGEEIRGMYNFECGRCNRTGRTRNAVSWKLGQRVFGARQRLSGEGRTVERRKRRRRRGKERAEGGAGKRRA